MQKFKKAAPSKTRHVAVPEWAYDRLGGRKGWNPLLVLSILMGHAVLTEDKRASTPRGTVDVPLGHAWCSLETVREDNLAGTGLSLTYNQANYAVKKLSAAGLILGAEIVFPETRGVYGKIYEIEPTLFNPDQPHINVVQGYQLFHYGNPNDFKIGEIVVGDFAESERYYELKAAGFGDDYIARDLGVEKPQPIRRGNYGLADRFAEQIAREGLERPAFVTVGRWRSKEDAKRRDTPIFVPYFLADLDRSDFYQAFLDARELTFRAEEQGYDLDQILVGPSGHKGFHALVSMAQVGSPIFADHDAASEVLAFMGRELLGDIERDRSVESPRSLIRVAGSRHAKTGKYKVLWTAREFQSLEFDDVLAAMEGHAGSAIIDPYSGEHVDEVMAGFIDLSRRASISLYESLKARGTRGGTKAGPVINALIGGVAEGTEWHPSKSPSREVAAYNLACWLEEGKDTGDEAIDQARREGGTKLAMKVWNERNSPPLQPHEIRGPIRSAVRRIHNAE